MKSQKTDYVLDVRFEDCLRKIQIGANQNKKPVILESIGKAPEQYPAWEGGAGGE